MSVGHLTHAQSDITSALSEIASLSQIVYMREPKL
jgi:hypothetical protein